jgi:hypothetical protein
MLIGMMKLSLGLLLYELQHCEVVWKLSDEISMVVDPMEYGGKKNQRVFVGKYFVQ